MDTEEVIRKYIEIFCLVLKVIGEKTGNKKYQGAKELMEREHIVDELKDTNLPIPIIIAILILHVLIDIHGVDFFDGKDSDFTTKYVDSMWINYLRKPTNTFLRKNGLETIKEDLSYYEKIRVFRKQKI